MDNLENKNFNQEDESTNLDSEENDQDLMSMYEESFKRFKEGEVVTGKIIAIDNDHVLIDIGYKSEGEVSIHEFKDEEGNLNASVGDNVEVVVEWWNDEDEVVNLSKEKAEKIKVWEDIKKIYDEDGTIEGVVLSRVKGGFSVDIGLKAFLPGSQADMRPVHSLDDLVGRTFEFKILKYSKKRSNIVLSRRAILEKEREEARASILASIYEGKDMEGVVKNITEYGVFIDLGGVDGLLHITDISWGRVKAPSDVFSIGESVTVKILSIDLENKKISLGKKQLVPDPWTTIEQRYELGAKIIGKVVSLTDYGAFIELEEGIEGLIHISEMSWTKNVRRASQVVSVNDIIEVAILDLKPEARRISLGMKQIQPNPWDIVAEKYPIGTTIEGKIKNITDFGMFIGIDEDIDGLVHISDISWTKRIKHPSEIYKKGDTVQAVVLAIDKEHGKFSLSIKHLSPDPWITVNERYKVDQEITGTITSITDFGVFVELEEGVEGLIHTSEIDDENVKTLTSYNVSDIVTAMIINVNKDERRIGLSIKRLKLVGEENILNGILDDDSDNSSTQN
mmetsp:Transcript_807/g.619  ORF Transcript_807/g.619 Transcript_807/m.619 type:complete len:565 (+) Transcript_807:356-2050(+)